MPVYGRLPSNAVKDVASLLFALSRPGGEETARLSGLATLLRLHKHARQHRVYHRLLQVQGTVGTRTQEWLEVQRFLDKVYSELAQIGSIFVREGIQSILIKGPALRRYYGSCVREFRDVDLVIPDLMHFWDAIKLLRARGYEYDYFPMVAQERGAFRGLAGLRRISEGVEVKVELNGGSFPIATGTWLPDWIWTVPALLQHDEHGFQIPAPSLAALVLISEVHGNPHLRVRDAVDFDLLARSSIEWPWLLERLSQLGLLIDSWRLAYYHARLSGACHPNLPNALARDWWVAKLLYVPS